MQRSWDSLRYCRSPGECVRLLHLFPYTCLLLKMIRGRAGSMLSGECPGLSTKRDAGDIFYICVSLCLKAPVNGLPRLAYSEINSTPDLDIFPYEELGV